MSACVCECVQQRSSFYIVIMRIFIANTYTHVFIMCVCVCATKIFILYIYIYTRIIK